MTAPHDPYRRDDEQHRGATYGGPPNHEQPYDPRQSGNVYGQPAGGQYGPPQPGYGQPPQQWGHQPGWQSGPPQGYGHPPQPAYGAGVGPAGYGAPPPKKSSAGKVIGIIAAVLVGLCVFGGIVNAVGGGTDTATTGESAAADVAAPEPADSSAPAQKKPEKKAPGLNTPVRDGKFEFTVKSVQCGKTQVGSEYLNKEAQGQFCLVTVSVKNIGDRAQLFDSSSQKAFNAEGQEYNADGAAGIYANPNGETFLNEINPGNQVSGVVPFDIPKGQKITKLELHDSPFSGGVEVSVS
ncbi:DUF4352 domain-containing protein [Cryptosporangium japonicum]|uniref:DUF4352 domain-containing protein n=1 Tax=Cryptosporangium japonicum TaxID=80872 RepID=A0ABP3DY18_9ACTN